MGIEACLEQALQGSCPLRWRHLWQGSFGLAGVVQALQNGQGVHICILISGLRSTRCAFTATDRSMVTATGQPSLMRKYTGARASGLLKA